MCAVYSTRAKMPEGTPLRQVIRFYAARPIEAAEELTIFYGTNLWFEDRREDDAPSGSPAVSSDSDDDVKMLARLRI